MKCNIRKSDSAKVNRVDSLWTARLNEHNKTHTGAKTNDTKTEPSIVDA